MSSYSETTGWGNSNGVPACGGNWSFTIFNSSEGYIYLGSSYKNNSGDNYYFRCVK
ncbi:hypothetical protein [Aliarcobacter butzleri]|uniref:hypothetical protein n=1 Tax=Aliarcobacter butzleri TaxID=28197 RepID=UPI00186A5F94|nr:hypothetical protein [Aliarcobacter butzleri]